MARLRFAAYCLVTGVMLIAAPALATDEGLATPVQAARIGALSLAITFIGAGPLLDRAIDKDRDSAYLYYLGVSGGRMLLFMFSVAIALYAVPALRERGLVLALTTTFCALMAVEVGFFLRRLRNG